MNTLLTFVLLLFLLDHSCTAAVAPSMPKTGCCYVYHEKGVPKKSVRHVEVTHSHCQTKDIVITTVCERTVCFKPDSDYAKKILADFTNSPDVDFNTNQCTKKN